jgi:hypothetical protein
MSPASALWRASAIEMPPQLLALSAEMSITLRVPARSLASISAWPTAMALPMALRPNARRGGASRARANAAALSGPSMMVQGTTTSWESTAPHST